MHFIFIEWYISGFPGSNGICFRQYDVCIHFKAKVTLSKEFVCVYFDESYVNHASENTLEAQYALLFRIWCLSSIALFIQSEISCPHKIFTCNILVQKNACGNFQMRNAIRKICLKHSSILILFVCSNFLQIHFLFAIFTYYATFISCSICSLPYLSLFLSLSFQSFIRFFLFFFISLSFLSLFSLSFLVLLFSISFHFYYHLLICFSFGPFLLCTENYYRHQP